MKIHGLDGRPLEKQHKIFCKHLKAKKAILHTILLGVGPSIPLIPNTILKSLALIHMALCAQTD